MQLRTFETRQAAGEAAAVMIGQAVERMLTDQGEAALMVSGGSSPGPCLDTLSRYPLDWSRVSVTLTDERCVPVTDRASNERMVREMLLKEAASTAVFVRPEPDALAGLPKPYACCLVGMGEDGHFSSIFPDLPDRELLLSPDSGILCRSIRTESSEIERITLSLAEIIQSRLIVLLAFGENKRAVIDAPGELPISALLEQQRVPVEVLWAA